MIESNTGIALSVVVIVVAAAVSWGDLRREMKDMKKELQDMRKDIQNVLLSLGCKLDNSRS